MPMGKCSRMPCRSGSSSKRSSSTTRCRRHHVSMCPFGEVGVATDGLMRFSYDDDEEELVGSTVEEVLVVMLWGRSSDAVDRWRRH
jgi:hypothetical protein